MQSSLFSEFLGRLGLVLYVAAKPRRVGQNLCRKQLASTFLDSKIAKESISVIESCHRSRADALQGHFRPTSISNSQQPDQACINFCLSHSENSVQMHACMICRSEFSPEWLNQRMHAHRPARIRSGGCMTGNRKNMPKKSSTEKSANVIDRRRSILNQLHCTPTAVL